MTPDFPYPCLLADVGGTNARFVFVDKPNAPLSQSIRLPTGGHGDFAITVRQALEKGGFAKPRSFLLAAAGAIDGRRLTFSNASTMGGLLTVDGPMLKQKLGLEQGILLNDFEALSLSLPFIPQTGLMPLGGKASVVSSPLASPQIVVGAGTGLGVGALLRHEECYIPMASEGGHTAMGPETVEDFALWPFLGKGRISGDELLSGRGITRLYKALAQSSGARLLDDAPAQISARALDASEPLAVQTIQRFLEFLGRFAGDMAITFGSSNGVFIGGGIAPRLASIIAASPFRAAFEAKDVYRDFMAQIPVWLITASDPALIGLAELARSPQSIALDYEARCWV
jgi:glucokinase